MNEDIKFILDSTKEGMDGAIKHLEKQFSNIRAGKASPAMLGSVMVDYYGSQTPLAQVANVNTPDGRTKFTLCGGICLYDMTVPLVQEFMKDWDKLTKDQMDGKWWP